MLLDERVASKIRELQRELEAQGELQSRAQLAVWYETFRRHFGPEVLVGLDGEALLDTLHNHANRDSLVYWLEFKGDDELPDIFGSIAGGSALKFGIYRRKDTGAWMTGTPQAQRELKLKEAIVIARRHRDLLVRGGELLEKLTPASSMSDLAAIDAPYTALQAAMDTEVPGISDTSWAHKYFSMLFPDKVDRFHNADWQRYHLIRMLQRPPDGEGRYRVGGRYVALALELELSLNTLCRILTKLNGPPRSYWRVGTTDEMNVPRKWWKSMKAEQFVAVGWPKVGDLSSLTHDNESKEKLRALMKSYYPDDPQTLGRQLQQLFNFLHWIKEGHIVVAADGGTILGIGQVTGGYEYVPKSPFPHRRKVEWLSLGDWKLPVSREGLMTTVTFFKKPENKIEIERRLLDRPPPVQPPHIETGERAPDQKLPPKPTPNPNHRLSEVAGQIQAILERKGQVILYGPPGTGKTWHAEKTARELSAWSSFGAPFDALEETQQRVILGSLDGFAGTVRMCCFHPAYGYEDFLEGYRPEPGNGQVVFTLRDGLFKRLCREAIEHPTQRFYLIIDEINRGDIPRIFGELLTVLEKSKRGKSVLLPLSGTPFQVPDNVYLIGTMNTADRSIALLDTALRRRFGFLELMPEPKKLGGSMVGGIPLGPWLEALNRRICKHVGRDARNLQIGHAYLLEQGAPVSEFGRFARVVQEDLVPLLEEYCYEDYTALEKILGKGLVDLAHQRVRHELFELERQQELMSALLQPCPEIVTSSQAVNSDVEREDEEAELEADQGATTEAGA